MDSLGYAPRNALLADMGYTSYAVYLESVLWDGIRTAVMSRKPGCALCRRPAQVIHHDTYTAENLSGASAVGLHPLCHGCHHRIEFTKAGDKLPLHHVRKKFAAGFKFRQREARRAALGKAVRAVHEAVPPLLPGKSRGAQKKGMT